MIFLLAISLYGISVFGGFVQDDRRIILADSSLGHIESLFNAWTSPYYKDDPQAGLYRPLNNFSLGLDSVILGNHPWGYRLMNIIFYGLFGVAVYALGKALFKKEEIAFWLALLFVALPVHVEDVANIVGRGEILSDGLVILAVVLALKKFWSWSMLAYVGAVLSKESALIWCLPLGSMLLASKTDREKKLGLLITGGMFLVFYLLVRWGILGANIFRETKATIVENPLKFLPFWSREMTAIGLIAFGLSKVIFPWHLSYDYSYNQIPPMGLVSPWFWGGVGLVLLSVFLLVKYRKERLIFWGLTFFWLPLVTTANIFSTIGTIFGERLWLMPSLGVLVIFFWMISKHWSKMIIYLLACILVLFGIRTMVRSFDWLSEHNLYIHDGKIATNSVLAQSNMAAMYLKDRNFTEAKKILEKGNNIYPNYPMLVNNWGIYYWWTGNPKKALGIFKKCVKVDPGNAACRGNIGELENE